MPNKKGNQYEGIGGGKEGDKTGFEKGRDIGQPGQPGQGGQGGQQGDVSKRGSDLGQQPGRSGQDKGSQGGQTPSQPGNVTEKKDFGHE